MFASRLNKKLDKYLAWQPDPDAWAIDAFSLDWEPIIGFYFPRFNMVGRVLEKMEVDRATGVVVVPSWPTQTWFPKCVDMASGEILYFDMWLDNLFLPFRRNQQHRLAGKTILLVAVCKSERCKNKVTPQKPSPSSLLQNGSLLYNCIRDTSINGQNFARGGTLYQRVPLCNKE